MLKIAGAISISIAILAMIPESFASRSGYMNEIIGDEFMQIYVIGVDEQYPKGENKLVYIDVLLKNEESIPRKFNPSFAKLIDSDSKEHEASPLLGTMVQARIPHSDVFRGKLVFSMPNYTRPSMLVWQELDRPPLMVDLTSTKVPPDPMLESAWEPIVSKGTVLSDDRSEIVINGEQWNKFPKLYALDLTIRNVGNETIKYSPTFFFVKDQDRRLFPVDLFQLGSLSNPLLKGDLEPGKEVRGQIIFSLPDSTSRVMLIYDENLGTGSYLVTPEFPTILNIVIFASLVMMLVLTKLDLIKRFLKSIA